eukprot:CAMPEP_0196751144 /NCGR_PEP_ID=MMETSP1091-20130531/82854_1 /TAXON_ID=302021 /ORGANISM="Rhodomonas sp., Strain CCMP768" /LENGTH=45 /DNA_ID= /DNA_START= /DNA_END= /DNA_ORIENTATION=
MSSADCGCNVGQCLLEKAQRWSDGWQRGSKSSAFEDLQESTKAEA